MVMGLVLGPEPNETAVCAAYYLLRARDPHVSVADQRTFDAKAERLFILAEQQSHPDTLLFLTRTEMAQDLMLKEIGRDWQNLPRVIAKFDETCRHF